MTQNPEQLNEDIRRRNKDQYQACVDRWIALANDRLFEINKQLLGIALIILPLSGSIVLSDKKLSDSSHIFLVEGWICLLMSIISGFRHMWVDSDYFKYLADAYGKRAEIWSYMNNSAADLQAKEDKLEKIQTASSNRYLYTQAFTLMVGVILIMLVAYGLLNSDRSNTYIDIPQAEHCTSSSL